MEEEISQLLLSVSEDPNSSGSVYQPADKGSETSSDFSDPIQRHIRLTAQKKRHRSGFIATSTPKTSAFEFQDEEDDELYNARHILLSNGNQDDKADDTPRQRQGRSRLTDDILEAMNLMEGRLLGAFSDLNDEVKSLKTEVAELKVQLKERDTQIATMGKSDIESRRVPISEKPTTHLRATLRAALAQAEKEKGLKIDLNVPIDALQNTVVSKYMWNYAKTVHPQLKSEEFKVAAARIHKSVKERQSRQTHGTADRHRVNARKQSRKSLKSKSRLKGLESLDLPDIKRARYERAMGSKKLMSSEDSTDDEEGRKAFKTRRRAWESSELRELKRQADQAYEILKGEEVSQKTRRVFGPESTAPPPTLQSQTDRWVAQGYIYHGVL